MPYIGIVGGGDASVEEQSAAEALGRALGGAGAIIVCGGRDGVMAAACRGAKEAGALTVGVLPGEDRHDANAWLDVALPTGLGELRNGLVVRASDVIVAVGGEYGTLSEVALALKTGVPVVGLATWRLTRPDGETDQAIRLVETADEAASAALELAGGR